MKPVKYSIFLLMALMLIGGCGKKKEQQILDLQAKNAQLNADFEQKDSLLNELFLSMNDIERNLADITAREKLITDAPDQEKRMNTDLRDKIMDEIIMINNIMEENKKKLAQLREQLKKSDTRIAALEETIKLLTAKLEAKEMELESLKSDLARLNFTIGSLNATVDTLRGETAEQSRIINQQDALIGEMNTVWYVIGTKKELTDKGIIEKAGGLFSGERKMMEQINPAHFTTADMRETKKIAFESAKVELATVHPEGTYTFIQENGLYNGIEILDPVEFWKSSRFLVVIIK